MNWRGRLEPGAAPRPIADNEPVRLGILAALFPGMRIEAVSGSPATYRVSGPSRNETERFASEKMIAGTFSNDRTARLQVFDWPRRNSGYGGIVHYRFDGASPAGSCTAMSRVFRAASRNRQWVIEDDTLLPTQHHTDVQPVRLLDVTGDGVEELLVEADMGGVGAQFSIVDFRLSKGKLEKWFEAPVWASLFEEGEFQQTLDVERTRSERGARVCFTETTSREGEQRFDSPPVGGGR